MTKKKRQFFHDSNVISELMLGVGGDSLPEVPIFDDVDIAELVKGDDDPLFITLPIVAETLNRGEELGGISRFYPKHVVQEIATQIKDKRPGGILGHLKPEDRSSRVDVPALMWVGAKFDQAKNTLFGKAYVMPTANNVKTWLRKAKAAGQKVAVSIYGMGKQVWDDTKNAFRVDSFTLESIDLASPERAGMDLGGNFALTTEMVGVADTDSRIQMLNTFIDALELEKEDVLKAQVFQEEAEEESELEDLTSDDSEELEDSETNQERSIPMDVSKWIEENPEEAEALKAHYEAEFSKDAKSSTDQVEQLEASLEEMVSLIGAGNTDEAKQVLQEMTEKVKEAEEKERDSQISTYLEEHVPEQHKSVLGLIKKVVVSELGTTELTDETLEKVLQETIEEVGVPTQDLILGKKEDKPDKNSEYLEVKERKI